MNCNICDLNLTKECNFLHFLDSIKAHYLECKNQIKEKDLEIIALKKLNTELNKKLIDIQQQQDSTSDHAKRRKNSSADNSSDMDAIKMFRQVDLLHNLNNNSSLGLTCSENMIKSNENSINVNENQTSASFDHQGFRTPNKNELKISNILSPIENKVNLLQNDSSILLPKMLKRPYNTNSPNSDWISRDKMKQSAEKCKNKINWEMSFIQPIKMNNSVTLDSSTDIIACSQNAEKENKRKDRNIFQLKTKKRLKQPKLEFDKKTEVVTQKEKKTQINETTLCEDVIEASPVVKEVKVVRTLRKLNRKNSDDELFDFKNAKKSESTSMSTITQEEFDGITSTPKSSSFPETKHRQIKNEPVTTIRVTLDEISKNKENSNSSDKHLFEQISSDSTKISDDKVGAETSSCLILPSLHDVVCIDDTDDQNFDVNTADLFNEMLRQDDQTQPILKKMEKQQMKAVNSNKSSIACKMSALKQNPILYIDSEDSEYSDADITHCDTLEQEILLGNLSKKNLSEKKVGTLPDMSGNVTTKEPDVKPELNKNVPHHNCNECSAYKNYLIRTGCGEAEIVERLKNCKKHKPLKLHLTPENFWEPRLLSFPENDPRREVLIDYRFAKNSAGSNKENEQ